MDKEEGKQVRISEISFSLQWIAQGKDCHLDSAGKRKDENSQSTFTLGGRVAVVFTRRAVSRFSG
jgi:hypothetical protein